MRHTNMNKLICSLMVCSMIFASGIFVFADTNSESVDNMKSATLVKRAPSPMVAGFRHGGFKVVIDKLVEEGKLSREKADAIDKYVQENKEKQELRKGHKYGLIKELIDAKIINDAEAEVIRVKFREIRQKAFDDKLNVLVQNKTITQAQADKVKIYFENARKEKQEGFKDMQNMTEEQRKAFFKEHKKNGAITKLVDDGVLTKEQADMLINALREGQRENCKQHKDRN